MDEYNLNSNYYVLVSIKAIIICAKMKLDWNTAKVMIKINYQTKTTKQADIGIIAVT